MRCPSPSRLYPMNIYIYTSLYINRYIRTPYIHSHIVASSVSLTDVEVFVVSLVEAVAVSLMIPSVRVASDFQEHQHDNHLNVNRHVAVVDAVLIALYQLCKVGIQTYCASTSPVHRCRHSPSSYISVWSQECIFDNLIFRGSIIHSQRIFPWWNRKFARRK